MVKEFKLDETWSDHFDVTYSIVVVGKKHIVAKDSDGNAHSYTIDGRYFKDFDSSRDLVEKVL